MQDKILPNGHILVGDYAAHPVEHAVAADYLNHHYGKEGTEGLQQIRDMIDTHTAGVRHGSRASDDLRHPPVITHMLRRRIIKGLDRMEPQSAAHLLPQFLHSTYYGFDSHPFELVEKEKVVTPPGEIHPFSSAEQHKMVDIYDKILNRGNPEHIAPSEANWEVRESEVYSPEISRKAHAQFLSSTVRFDDESARMRMHDVLDKARKGIPGAPAEQNKKRREIAAIFRGHMIKHERKSEAEQRRMWHGFALDSNYADLDSTDAHRRRKELRDLGIPVAQMPGHDVDIFTNNRPLERLAASLNGHLPRDRHIALTSDVMNMLDTHPGFAMARKYHEDYTNRMGVVTKSLYGPGKVHDRLLFSLNNRLRSEMPEVSSGESSYANPHPRATAAIAAHRQAKRI